MNFEKLKQLDEKIETRRQKILSEIKKLRAQKQILLNKQRVQERKERTHRLIQIGALTEKYFATNDIVKVEELLQKFSTLFPTTVNATDEQKQHLE